MNEMASQKPTKAFNVFDVFTRSFSSVLIFRMFLDDLTIWMAGFVLLTAGWTVELNAGLLLNDVDV